MDVPPLAAYAMFAGGIVLAAGAVRWTWLATQSPRCEMCGGPMSRMRRADGRIIRAFRRRRYVCAAGHTDERPTIIARVFG